MRRNGLHPCTKLDDERLSDTAWPLIICLRPAERRLRAYGVQRARRTLRTSGRVDWLSLPPARFDLLATGRLRRIRPDHARTAGEFHQLGDGSLHGADHLFRALPSSAVRCCCSYFRKFFTKPIVAWAHAATSACWFAGWAMTDPNFRAIVTKPDNVPIVMLIFSVGFFTWLALRRAVRQRRPHRARRAGAGKADDEKVLVWPDLVYTELIAMIIATFVLVVWAVLLQGAAGAAGDQRQGPEPVEGAVVLPRPAGNARLLRSVDGRRRAADHDHRRPDRHALHRLQPEGQRLLHLRRAQVRRDAPSCSASWCCGWC